MEFEPWIIAAIIGITDLIKLFGVEGKWNILSAVLLGVAIQYGLAYAPEHMMLFLQALLLGLTAAGLYKVGKSAGESVVDKLNNK